MKKVALVTGGASGIGKAIVFALAKGEYIKEAINTVPLRIIINPEEVAALVSYLASAAGDNITGQSMMLNGGCVMS